MAVPTDDETTTDVELSVVVRSFEAFFRDEYGRAIQLAIALTGRRSVAEELTQDAFVAAYRNWARVSGLDRPDLWLRRVLLNACTSAWRRRRSEIGATLRLGRERPPDVLLDERNQAVWDAVRALPRRQREVVALVVLEDRTVRDVAAVLGCGEESVRTHLRRGRAALAHALGEPEVDGEDEEGERDDR